MGPSGAGLPCPGSSVVAKTPHDDSQSNPLIKSEPTGVAQVVDDVGNPLVFTAREVLGHSSQLASICLSTAGFVALLNTVITPITPHPDGHTSALLGHEHGTLECTRIAKGDCVRGRRVSSPTAFLPKQSDSSHSAECRLWPRQGQYSALDILVAAIAVELQVKSNGHTTDSKLDVLHKHFEVGRAIKYLLKAECRTYETTGLRVRKHYQLQSRFVARRMYESVEPTYRHFLRDRGRKMIDWKRLHNRLRCRRWDRTTRLTQYSNCVATNLGQLAERK